MTAPLLLLSRGSLLTLADALDSERLLPPFTALAVQRYAPGQDGESIAAELQRLADGAMQPSHMAYMLRLLAEERQASQHSSDRVELVWTGPEVAGAGSRDTGVVVRELFKAARRYVLVAGFAVYQGKHIFRVLAERMDESPELTVRMFLNVERPHRDKIHENLLLKRFADRFRQNLWPGLRLPELFYDPRTIALQTEQKASLHAKCLVIDDERAFVTSANFTEAAQERNIEAGVLIEGAAFAKALRGQFENLVATGQLLRLPGLA